MKVKPVVRQIEAEDGVLIFDDTIAEKEWTDESDLICWHYDHCKIRSVKGINLLTALYFSGNSGTGGALHRLDKKLGDSRYALSLRSFDLRNDYANNLWTCCSCISLLCINSMKSILWRH